MIGKYADQTVRHSFVSLEGEVKMIIISFFWLRKKWKTNYYILKWTDYQE